MNKTEFNEERPLIMHIDLNSCFATVEQQARPMLSGKPIAIVNRRSEYTAIITASYEAKAMGVKVGLEIKQRLKDEIGVWMRCNVGIATNRFLAKTAAGLHKPDGLDVLTSQNIKETLGDMKLTDLTGIAHRNQERLNSVGIFTPLQFLDADAVTLHKIVFKSVVGEWWYKRLRGWEVDDVETKLGRVGRQYVLERFDLTHTEVLQRLHHLCESVGSRMRSQNLAARGVYVYAKSLQHGCWHSSALTPLPFYSTRYL